MDNPVVKKIVCLMVSVYFVASGIFAQVAEELNRGVVALNQVEESGYIGWRLL